MYVRIKRERLTLFFRVDASTTVDEVKARVFDSLSFVERDQEHVNSESSKPVVGEVVCEPGVRIGSASDVQLALCRRVQDECKDMADTTTERRDQDADVRVETRMLPGSSTIADSKIENDDVLCIVLPGEDADGVFRKTSTDCDAED